MARSSIRGMTKRTDLFHKSVYVGFDFLNELTRYLRVLTQCFSLGLQTVFHCKWWALPRSGLLSLLG
jgi:hypothetical protein